MDRHPNVITGLTGLCTQEERHESSGNQANFPHILKADQDAYASLTAFQDYRSTNPACTPEELAKALEAMHQARKQEVQIERMLGTARDAARAAEWCFHNAMLDAKLQVIAQYGDSSNEMQSLGLKKKSERRRPGRRVAQSRSA